MTDPHEFAFERDGLEVDYCGIDTLPEFAGIPLATLSMCQEQGVSYYLPIAEQFVTIYRASSQDSYRTDHNKAKDFAKIAYLESLLT